MESIIFVPKGKHCNIKNTECGFQDECGYCIKYADTPEEDEETSVPMKFEECLRDMPDGAHLVID